MSKAHFEALYKAYPKQHPINRINLCCNLLLIKAEDVVDVKVIEHLWTSKNSLNNKKIVILENIHNQRDLLSCLDNHYQGDLFETEPPWLKMYGLESLNPSLISVLTNFFQKHPDRFACYITDITDWTHNALSKICYDTKVSKTHKKISMYSWAKNIFHMYRLPISHDALLYICNSPNINKGHIVQCIKSYLHTSKATQDNECSLESFIHTQLFCLETNDIKALSHNITTSNNSECFETLIQACQSNHVSRLCYLESIFKNSITKTRAHNMKNTIAIRRLLCMRLRLEACKSIHPLCSTTRILIRNMTQQR